MDFVNTNNAPAAIGPYSQAVSVGNFVFCSGQTPLNPATMKIVGDDVATQTRQVFKNIEAVLSAAGLSLAHVVKTTVFLKSMDDFKAMNAVYESAFGDHKPARSTVAVAQLPMDVRVEIESIAQNP